VNITGALGQFNHFGNENIIPPRIILCHELFNMPAQHIGFGDMLLNGVGLNIDLVDVEQVLRVLHREDRVH